MIEPLAYQYFPSFTPEVAHSLSETVSDSGSPLEPNLAQNVINDNSPQLAKAWGYCTNLKFGRPLVKLGEMIQGGHDKHAETGMGLAQYVIGGFVQVVGNCIDGVVEVVKNNAIAVFYGITKWNGRVSQKPALKEIISEVRPYTQLLRCTQSEVTQRVPTGYQCADDSVIPKEVLARRVGNDSPETGAVLTMHGEKKALIKDEKDKALTVLCSDPLLSALQVGVFLKKDNGKEQIILCFDGTTSSRLGTFASDISAHIGINPSAFREAKKLVKAFVKMHPEKEIVVTGHSLGGALASYAVASNSLKATGGLKAVTFNSLGLSAGQRYQLGDKLNNANVTNINTGGDFASQILPLITPMEQIGKRFVLPKSDNVGHSLKEMIPAFEESTQKPVVQDQQWKVYWPLPPGPEHFIYP